MKKAALHNLGCKVNAYETEAMQELLEKNGYEIVPFHDLADVYVINTCSVTNMADRKSRQMLHRAKKQKLLFSAVRDRDDRGKMIDVLLPVTELDRANQIFQRMLYQEPDRQPEAHTRERARDTKDGPEKGPQKRQKHSKDPTARQDPQPPTQGRQSSQTAPRQAEPPKKESRSGCDSHDTRTSSSTPKGPGTMTERPSVEGRLRAYRAQLERSSVPAKEKTKSRPKTR